jgi:hypothetical protein
VIVGEQGTERAGTLLGFFVQYHGEVRRMDRDVPLSGVAYLASVKNALELHRIIASRHSLQLATLYACPDPSRRTTPDT